MSDSFQTLTKTDFEARARKLRAEAARDGFVAMRGAIAQAFAALRLMGAKTA